jgi:hypothetical protein
MLSISSTQDPVTKGGHVRFQELVPGARTTRHVTIRGAGHFIQEEKPDELAQVCSLLLAPGPWLDDPSGGVLPLMNAARTHARTHGVVAMVRTRCRSSTISSQASTPCLLGRSTRPDALASHRRLAL